MPWLRFLIRALEKLGTRSRQPEHLVLGKHGETEAYFYLKNLGYQFVATNFRVPHNRGEIDLIAWDNGTLCFVEVKTRSDDSFAPPSTAVTANKRRHILSVARRYLRRLPSDRPPSCRFDILSIVASDDEEQPRFTLQKGAFTWDAGRPQRRQFRDFVDRHYWRKK
jgi:putative endonuclease